MGRCFCREAKKWLKDLTPEDLKEWVTLFRVAVREKRGLD
jgi:hypothetical protein